jgi:hypothetical protein
MPNWDKVDYNKFIRWVRSVYGWYQAQRVKTHSSESNFTNLDIYKSWSDLGKPESGIPTENTSASQVTLTADTYKAAVKMLTQAGVDAGTWTPEEKATVDAQATFKVDTEGVHSGLPYYQDILDSYATPDWAANQQRKQQQELAKINTQNYQDWSNNAQQDWSNYVNQFAQEFPNKFTLGTEVQEAPNPAFMEYARQYMREFPSMVYNPFSGQWEQRYADPTLNDRQKYESQREAMIQEYSQDPADWIKLHQVQNAPNPFAESDYTTDVDKAQQRVDSIESSYKQIMNRVNDKLDNLSIPGIMNPTTEDEKNANKIVTEYQNAKQSLSNIQAQGVQYDNGKPELPATPDWLSKLTGLKSGQMIRKQKVETPSGQLWNLMSYNQRRQLGGYTDWVGKGQNVTDLQSQMQMMQPDTPSIASGWSASRKR